nr:reverse transcriptase domain-containing protein [Tanacetum cinerariifolium]
MEELCQPSLNGQGGPTAPIAIQAMNFGLKNDMIQQSIKVNGVTDDAIRLYLFPHSLTHQATAWFDRFLRNSIKTFEQMAKMFLGKYFPPSTVTKLINEITNFRQHPDESLFEAWEHYKLSIDRCGTFMKRRPKECYDLIENMTAHHNDWDTLAQWSESSSFITSSSDLEFIALKAEMAEINKNLMRLLQVNQQVKAVTPNCETCGGPHPYNDCPATVGQTPNVYAAGAYQGGPTIPTTSSSSPQVVERETQVTKDMVPPTNNGSTKDVQPSVVHVETLILNPEPVVAPFIEPVVAPTERALIDVFERELTLRVGKEAITFNLDQTSRYSANYNDMTMNRIDVIDMAYEEYSLEVLGLSDVITSGNPTPYYDPIIFTSSSTLTPFGDSDFLLKEVDAFLALEDDATSLEIDHFYFDPEGGILLLESFLNDDPSLPPPNQGNYLPQVQKELKIYEAKNDKSSIDEPPEVELKDLPPHLKYVLKSHKRAIAWKLSVIKGINPEFCTHKNLMEDDFEPAVQHQRRVNPKIYDIIKKEVLKLFDGGLIYPISDSPSLNEATRKDHFPLPFMDQMLERLTGNEYYCFLDGFLGYFQIPIDLIDQEKTTFMCPYGTFAYHHMPFGLCNASGTFQRCMMAMFHDMIKKTMKVFMDDFSVFGNLFGTCLSHLEKMLKRCEDTNLCLNWEMSHFMVKEGIILDHKISKNGIEVDKAKVDVIAKLPHPTTVKGIRSFLGPAGFYRRFIQDFLKIARPMTRLLEKDTSFFFSKECVEAFQTLKRKLAEAPILISPDWDLPFELMCDASDFAIGVVLGKCQEKHFRPIHYASKTMIEAESNYTTTEKEMLAVVYAFEKFRSYLIMNKSIVYTDHSTLKYLCAKKDSKARLLRWRLFPSSRGNKYILVAVDYLSKWVEAKAFPTNDARVVCKFLKSLFSRFGTPCAIISDRGTHFCNDQFAKVMLKYGVTYRLATVYHPPTSGHVKVLNRGFNKNLRKDSGRKPCLLIKDRIFNVGDRVLLFNSRLKIFSSKLKTRWSGSFTITHVFPYGTVELSQTDKPNFKVNGHRLKHYFGEDIPKLVVPDLQTFPKEQ